MIEYNVIKSLSAQEAAYRVNGMPLCSFLRIIVKLNTLPPLKRYQCLKTKKEIDALNENSTDVFRDNFIDHYHNRLEFLSGLTLFEFAENYQVAYGSCWTTLHTVMGVALKKRKRPACVRTSKCHFGSNDYFYSVLLLLFLPHTNESELINEEHNYKVQLMRNIHRIQQSNSTNSKLLQQLHDALQLVAIDKIMSDCVINAESFDSTLDSPFTVNANVDMLAHDKDHLPCSTNSSKIVPASVEIAQLYSTLTNDQKGFVCTFLETTKVQAQGLFFLTGNAGSNKSYLLSFLIKLIKYKFFNCVTNLSPIMVAAPTGLAAQHIGGITIHKAFKLENDKTKMSPTHISCKTLTELRRAYSGIRFIIIDEVSMVSRKMLECIHVRLQQIKNNSKIFGGLNVICCGDFYQLPPICGMYAFQSPLSENFVPFNLKTNLRQNDDKVLLDLLNEIKTGFISPINLLLLQQRQQRSADIMLDATSSCK